MHEQNQQRPPEERVSLVLVGFSDPRPLTAIGRSLGWEGRVLSDPTRALYARLRIGRAPWWRVYNFGTLLTYLRAARAGRPSGPRTEEDTRQLGGDAVLHDGVVVRLWRPRSPDDRPSAREVLEAAVGLKGTTNR